jgi:molybdopterin-guanine dinucleotide biosynthesis protein
MDQVLMIGGNARKSGKTTMICHILDAYGAQHRIGAIKVALYDDAADFSVHYPQGVSSGIWEVQETDPSVPKDSGRFLSAGATESWFMAALPEKEQQVIDQIGAIRRRMDLVIVESNTLRKKIEPGLYVMVIEPGRKLKQSALELRHLVDRTIETGSPEFDEAQRFIGPGRGSWMLKGGMP